MGIVYRIEDRVLVTSLNSFPTHRERERERELPPHWHRHSVRKRGGRVVLR